MTQSHILYLVLSIFILRFKPALFGKFPPVEGPGIPSPDFSPEGQSGQKAGTCEKEERQSPLPNISGVTNLSIREAGRIAADTGAWQGELKDPAPAVLHLFKAD